MLAGSEDEDDDDLMDFTTTSALVLLSRRTCHLNVPKSSQWNENVLSNFDDDRMRQMVRVAPIEFKHILCLIKEDPVFRNKNLVPQLPLDLQLKIALFRLGSSGDSASIRKIATLFGVGDGGTVITVTDRVITAIINLKSKFLFWPTVQERKKIVGDTLHELPGCIGYVDGTEIKLAESPIKDHEFYFSRKKQYSIKMQIVCDHSLKIRQATIGYRGSVHDAKILAESSIGRTPDSFFCERQWIAGDSAYPLSRNVITPFRQNSTELTKEKREKFNQYFSKFRVRVENCFGKLKEKFSSLKELRFRLSDGKSYQNCCRWILSCCILHNILQEFNSGEDDSEGDGINSQEDCIYLQEMNNNNDLRTALAEYINNKG